MPNPFNQQIIEEFRANHGEVGGYFEGARLILLTTTGARTGNPHTTPLGYLPDGDGTILVIASAGGSPRHPDWYRNVVANPRVTIESGAFTYEADAVVLEGEARDTAFARAVESEPGWAEYQAKTDRTIPVVALREVPVAGPPNINAGSMVEAIKVVHDAFRRELALIKKELIAGNGRSTLGAQLRVNCLTFCQGLHNHHTGEDTALFPFLADRHPELSPALTRLRDEHEHIAALVEALRQAVTTTENADPAAVLHEVERIIVDLEAHLAYEEEQLIPALEAGA
ncbi:nitroreductase family deazaflavin-dependent oxidoreductase [Streptomyces ipomoeae]|uniref:Hemerythrin HHE cation binding domain protein n=2 Tax=Streptomyces ipomoeae TaxID=103232 RepID=L1KXL2_9ACTN|nr:nitroreductase/quinone reductase family protein [Streptomyces ipomoeae]EKX65337.1 hemerythrin HHE cation binding domain protein [Streptomyces ipomoeae 91-03]MDX2697439.1 nitroreductase/quinone reductase family protein [Streptomyces ipomoeae]MDX2840730.1 nitroreductase/quinone reductase family protein [Streptomyces ipomoeae]TQE15624.1 nitroreductase family deazaflavin-dependent oxidoreductase [Streptomyces ipomoeae]TQE20467.1 nitroreductase family deazaflavin-dependent oxidoreductase [Strept